MTNSQQSDETTMEHGEQRDAGATDDTAALASTGKGASTGSTERAAEAQENVTPENVTPDNVTPDNVTQEKEAQEKEVPGIAVPEKVTPDNATPETVAPATPAESAPLAGSATPTPAPTGGPVPRPAAPRAPLPTAMTPRPGAGRPTAPHAHSTSLADAGRFARVEDDGHVFVLVDGEEHLVGQYPDATREEALAYFVRKYDQVLSHIALLEQRVRAGAPSSDMGRTAKQLRAQIVERAMVGDLRALENRIDTLLEAVRDLERAERATQDEVRAGQLAAREAIVAEAEELAGRDPATIQWKAASTRMNELFELWKAAQKEGPRLGRGTEDALWKRFRSSRTVFDRHRRAHFSQLDSDNAEAKRVKEALIERAEELSGSTDWGPTAAAYRRLMDEWKAAKRAGRKDDDALWVRFRAAQDHFFDARKAGNDAAVEEYSENLAAKEALLAEAQKILPVKDVAAAKKALSSIRDRWDEAGKVPRAEMGRIDAGLRRIEDAVRSAADEQWRKTDPETKARTDSALSQLETTIAQLGEDLAAAERARDTKRIASAQEALTARRQWLEMLQRSAREFS